ncbi:hypothetical protein V6N12_011657 [Hibiscus sabdariffa]|uniref:Uncharacterized protein n=1 Tax=Hibiscus sabdariffa TaxID=183260 RepID=A0ABR2APE3_9ROSI
MDPLLSQRSSIASGMLGTSSNFDMNFLIQTTSFAASLAAIYSASVVESTTVSCFELFQLRAPPLRQNTKPDCNRESSLSVWKLV